MLTGTLEEFALADVFRLVSLAKKTGTLRVHREAGHGEVVFQRGEVVMATSSLVRELIGQKLVRTGAVTEGQLRRALDEHASTGERVGRILVASGAVTPKALEDAVRGQTEDAVFDLLRWERGDFEWETRAAVDAEIPTAVSVENLIMEASRRLDELDIIRRKIPSEDAVVAMAVRPPEGAAEINITPDEWRLLVLVDGTRAVADIAEALGSDDFSVLRTLYGLVSAGLVEVVSGDGAGEPGRAAYVVDSPASSEPFSIEPEDLRPHAEGSEPAGEPDEAGQEWSQQAPGDGPLAEAATQVAAEDEEEPVSETGVGAPAPPGVVEPQGGAVAGADLDAPVERDRDAAREEPGEGPRSGADVAAERDAEPSAAEIAAGPGEESNEAYSGTPQIGDEAASNGDAGAAPAPEPPAEPRLDRSAVVRELAGLFSETEPVAARASERQQPAEQGDDDEADRRKRVEDDDQITRGLISRFIDGVKGL